MFEYRTTGRTINEAIENGLNTLKLKRTDVEIKVINNAKAFQDAVVVLCIDDAIVAKNEQIERLKSLQNLENQIAQAENLLEKSKAEKNNILESLTTQIMQDDNFAKNKEQIVALTKNFVDGIVCAFGVENFESEVEEDGEYLKINIKGKNLQNLIGFKGKTLASLQFLANVFASKFGRNVVKVRIDVNNYKANKEQFVKKLATKTAQEVIENKQEVALQPMNAFERLIVHNEIAKFEELTTQSVGEEPNRHIVVKLK